MSKEAEAKTGFTPVLRRCAGCGSELPEFGRYRAFFDAPDERCHDDDVCVKLRNDRLDATRLRRAAADDLYEALDALLNVPELADIDPEDRSEEAWEAERQARNALARARGETQ